MELFVIRTVAILSVLSVLWASSPAPAADPAAPQWVVVVAPAFRDAVRPLADHRRGEGFQVVQLLTTDVLSADEIRGGDGRKLRDRVNRLCRDHKGPSYVLLVGAVEPVRPEDAVRTVVPALDGGVGRMKGQPSDNGYGCPDDGRQPTVAVGRLPARTEPEAIRMVRKTLSYESDDRPAEWRHRLTVLAGVPAYNPLVDRLVETMAFARFDKLDPSWTGRAIYSNPSSRFCVPDDLLHDQARKYVEGGQAWTLYLGHSNAGGLWGGGARYLDRDDWATLKIAHGPGVLATFGCNGCQLRGDSGEGYGVAAVRNPDGPVAVIGSHGICFAAMVQLATDGLFKSTFAAKQPERLGESWLAVKAGVAKGDIDDLTFALLDAVDGDRTISQATQRLEHLEMFTRLGDPALKLAATPAELTLKTDEAAAAGATVVIHGTAPARLNGGRVQITAERPVGSEPADLETPPKELGPERDRALMRNHERANRFAVAEAEAMVKDGRFEAKLELPARLPWERLNVHAYAATETQEAARRAAGGRTGGEKSLRNCNKTGPGHGQAIRRGRRVVPLPRRLDAGARGDGERLDGVAAEPGDGVPGGDAGPQHAGAGTDGSRGPGGGLRSEYPGLDADAAVDLVAGEMAVGHDIQFFSFDLPNTAWTRSLYCAAGTLLLYWQANDLELPTTEPVLRAICASLKADE